MIRALLISLLFCVSANANDIYVEQAQEEPEETKVALETKSTEKELLSPLSTEKDKQYCSVVAGCYTVNN
jgi:hypothetical protein